MRKFLLFLLAVAVFNSCSSRKKKSDSTFLKGFSTYYNTLFNSKDALEAEINARKDAHQDNFYAPYITILTYDEMAASPDPSGNSMFGEDPGPGVPDPNQFQENRTGATVLEISEAKALKAIAKYSVLKSGEEKNKKMFDAHLLLAQSRLYRDKPLQALDALNYIFTNMRNDKRLPLARVYQGFAFSKMQDYSRAEEIFSSLKNDNLKKEYNKLRSIYHAEMLLNSGKKEAAAEELEEAFALNKNRELRSRIAFLRGQILSDLGRNEEARESFVTAYKNSNNFEFEVKSQIEIAKTFNGENDDYEGARDYIEKISKKGTYASRKNEFYYALGLMANKAGKKEEAQEYFRKSLAEKVSDPQIRGLNYYEIGKGFFEDSDYLAAGAYYDSALSVMTYEPSKVLLSQQTENIKQVSQNYYLVKRNDSILALTKMPEAEKIAYFNKYIDAIKEREAKEELERQREERNRGFDTGDYSANSIFANNTGGFQDFSENSRGGFYFANLNTVSKGEASFRQIWGSRSLSDNWRTSARSASIEDLRNEALGLTTAPDPRRLEPSFYIEQIPTKPEEISALKIARDTASLGLGRMYDAYFSDAPLATKTLYDLVDVQPEEDVKLQALYLIFAMNHQSNPAAAERAKQMILNEYPYTSYAEFVRNPQSSSFNSSSDEALKAYEDAYVLFSEEKYEESKALIDGAMVQYQKDALVPKFALLNAFNTGKTAGKEIMILQLEQIALNYAKTPEGIKAGEMLKYLESDLEIERTDESGRAIENVPAQAAPAAPVRTNPSRMAAPGDPDPKPEPTPTNRNMPQNNGMQRATGTTLQDVPLEKK